MKLLLNDKEIAHFLLEIMDYKSACEEIPMQYNETQQAIDWVNEKRDSHGNINLEKFKHKIKAKLQSGISKDLKSYVGQINNLIENKRSYNFQQLHMHIDEVINSLGEKTILDLYKTSSKQNFVKSVGYGINSNAEMIRRKNYSTFQEDCLIRNTVGNENLLVSKIDNNYPFWFIDSGYTNFLESNKKWHRLIHNHLHYGKMIAAPVDRLGNFKSFPQQWRTSGDRILVIEPGSFAANIFHVDLKTWKYEVEAELRKYTDKKIEFREKAPKKQRTKLYDQLRNEDYYCIVNINSNAATESIWAGIPAITLGTHITNPVTRNSIADINNLYRGNLADWLCSLSYSQFTYDELVDGTAAKIVKQYHV